MSACLSQTLNRISPVTLGLRVGIIGPEAFVSWVSGLLRMDEDVAAIKSSSTLSSSVETLSANLLIVDAGSLPAYLTTEIQDSLFGISLIAVSGSKSGALGHLDNVCLTDLRHTEWWQQLKEQTVQRRLQEFAGLVNALASEYSSGPSDDQTLHLDDGGEACPVPVSSVDWIRAAGNYVEVRVNGRSHLLRCEMHAVQNRLTRSFLRIHRKVIINMQRLASIEADSSTRLFATLTTGDRFPISRGRRHFVRSRWDELRARQQ